MLTCKKNTLHSWPCKAKWKPCEPISCIRFEIMHTLSDRTLMFQRYKTCNEEEKINHHDAIISNFAYWLWLWFVARIWNACPKLKTLLQQKNFTSCSFQCVFDSFFSRGRCHLFIRMYALFIRCFQLLLLFLFAFPLLNSFESIVSNT